MRSLGFRETLQMTQSIRLWRAFVSCPVPTPVLIEALGILNLTNIENWPARSATIDHAIESFVRHHVIEKYPDMAGQQIVRGLGAFIAVDRKISTQFRVMAAIRRRFPWVRWLPKLDSPAVDRHILN